MRIAINARFMYNDRLEGIGRYSFETSYRMIKTHPEHTFILIYDRGYENLFEGLLNVEYIHIPPQARHPLLWYIWFEIMLPVLFKLKKVFNSFVGIFNQQQF